MARHTNKRSMQDEAVKEMLEVAEYCVAFDKSKDSRWPGCIGCYGYPAAIMLLCIADCIGSVVENNGKEYDTKKNFCILNNTEYYNLNLSDCEVEAIRSLYRNKLSHNAYIGGNCILSIGDDNSPVIKKLPNKKKYMLYLKPLLKITRNVVDKYLQKQEW